MNIECQVRTIVKRIKSTINSISLLPTRNLIINSHRNVVCIVCKMVAQRLCPNFFKVLNISIFIILTVLAVYLSDEILVQYAAKDTSFSQSEIQVTEEDSPTVVFGFWPLKETNYSEEVPYMAYEV